MSQSRDSNLGPSAYQPSALSPGAHCALRVSHRRGRSLVQLPQACLCGRQLPPAGRHDHAADRHGHPPGHHLVPGQRQARRFRRAQAALLLLHGEFLCLQPALLLLHGKFACLQPSLFLFYYVLHMFLQGNIMTVAVFRRVTGEGVSWQ